MILRLKRNEDYWRMDKDTSILFIKYINSYVNIPKELLAYSDILFIDIFDSNLQNIGLLYGFSIEKNETLLLAEFFPDSTFLLSSEIFFNIRICGIIDQKLRIQKVCICRK